MGKFVFKSILLCCFVFLGLLMTDPFFGDNQPFKETVREFNEKDKDDLSLIFFGNSHSYSSFDPRVFEVELGVESINMASSAQSLIATKVVADFVLKETKPDLAVVNIFLANLSKANSDSFKKSSLVAIDNVPLTWQKMVLIFKNFPTKEWPLAFSETIRNHAKWSTLKDNNQPVIFKSNQDFYKGYNTYRIPFNNKTYAAFEKKYKKQNDTIEELTYKEKQLIDTIIEFFDKRDIPLLFINAPSYVYDVSCSFKTHADEVAKYLNDKGARFIEFNKIKDSLGLKKQHYRNPNHLNTNGAIITSQFLANYINNSLNFSTQKQKVPLNNNRYYHLSSKENTALFQKTFDSTVSQNLFGIKAAKFYQVSENRYELMFPLASDTIGSQPVRLEHDINKDEFAILDKVKKQYINFNKDSTKVVYYGKFSQNDVIAYKNKKCVVFSVFTPLKKLKNLSFHAGKQRRVTAFRIDSLLLDK